jgi:hypothetical protein
MEKTMTDPWLNAAECDKAAQVAADPRKRKMLLDLRDLWIAFGNHASLMSEKDRASETAKLAQIHTTVTSAVRAEEVKPTRPRLVGDTHPIVSEVRITRADSVG